MTTVRARGRLLLATDGVWDKVSADEAAALVEDLNGAAQRIVPRRGSAELVLVRVGCLDLCGFLAQSGSSSVAQ